MKTVKELLSNNFLTSKRASLTYTEEMKEQDLLWQEEKENFITMKSLQLSIVKEAKVLRAPQKHITTGMRSS